MSDASHMSGGKPIVPAPPEEQRYTLEEAQAHLQAQECLTYGHAYEHVETGAGDLVRVFCSRCIRSWGIKSD